MTQTGFNVTLCVAPQSCPGRSKDCFPVSAVWFYQPGRRSERRRSHPLPSLCIALRHPDCRGRFGSWSHWHAIKHVLSVGSQRGCWPNGAGRWASFRALLVDELARQANGVWVHNADAAPAEVKHCFFFHSDLAANVSALFLANSSFEDQYRIMVNSSLDVCKWVMKEFWQGRLFSFHWPN